MSFNEWLEIGKKAGFNIIEPKKLREKGEFEKAEKQSPVIRQLLQKKIQNQPPPAPMTPEMVQRWKKFDKQKELENQIIENTRKKFDLQKQRRRFEQTPKSENVEQTQERKIPQVNPDEVMELRTRWFGKDYAGSKSSEEISFDNAKDENHWKFLMKFIESLWKDKYRTDEDDEDLHNAIEEALSFGVPAESKDSSEDMFTEMNQKNEENTEFKEKLQELLQEHGEE